MRERQIKMRYHYTPNRMAKSRTPTTPNIDADVEQELSFLVGGNKNGTVTLEDVWRFLTN